MERPPRQQAAASCTQPLATQRKVLARAQVKAREVPAAPGTSRNAPVPQQQAVLQSLENSYSGPPHSHNIPVHRSWGLWEAGARPASFSTTNGIAWCDRVSSQRRAVLSSAVLANADKRTSTQGRVSTQGRISSPLDEDISQRMSEAEAWDVVANWRRVVDAATDSCGATQSEYAVLVQALDVRTLSPSDRRELEAQSQTSWQTILTLQGTKHDAEMCLLHNHMGLLTQIVRKLSSEAGNSAHSSGDMQVEGMAQLRACIWSFDQTRGFVFSTYLWSQLPTRIRQALAGKDSAVHVPRREMDLRRRVHAAMAATSRHQAHDPAPGGEMSSAAWTERLETVAAKTGASVAEVSRTLADARRGEFSPDSVVTEGDSWDAVLGQQQLAPRMQWIEQSGHEDEDDGEAQDASWIPELPHVLDIVNNVVGSMPKKQSEVLVLAYGLRGERKLTLNEIAKRCGMNSHVAVKYHLKKATEMLKQGLVHEHDLELSYL